MQYENMKRGIFLARPNRFLAAVQLDGGTQLCHVKNTGRCKELLTPGAAVWCQYHGEHGKRKTAYSLIAVQKGNLLVNMDSQAPNAAAAQWVRQGGLGFVPSVIRREVQYGDSRFDLYFEHDKTRAFLEVKGVTLEQGGTALFPDAPTARGVKHLRGLRRAVEAGFAAYALFVIQMAGMRAFRPNAAQDPDFAAALCDAADGGVQIFAMECDVTPDSMVLARPIPVILR